MQALLVFIDTVEGTNSIKHLDVIDICSDLEQIKMLVLSTECSFMTSDTALIGRLNTKARK